MLAQFPFEILGFHADNGSEYVNHKVARLLDKLRIEFTRSRPRHSNDNGLAETKNGAVVVAVPWAAARELDAQLVQHLATLWLTYSLPLSA